MRTMTAAVLLEPGKSFSTRSKYRASALMRALIKVTTRTICGTDAHILKGEYPVAPGRIVGHELVGVIEALARRRVVPCASAAAREGLLGL